MKNIKIFIIGLALLAGFTGCKNFLEVTPTDSITADALFASNEGIEAYLATLYYEMPMEDNAFMPTWGFHYQIGDSNNNGNFEIVNTDDAVGSQTYNIISPGNYTYWEAGYQFNNHVNSFFGYIDELKKADAATKATLRGEAWFLRAYCYFALARRYGGVSIITKVGDVSDSTTLYIDRSTEVKTWDWVLECCDSAAALLPTTFNSNHSRATKWAALALKSRAALHAASVGKYWDEAPLGGDAVDQGLVGGFTAADVQRYYQAVIDASAEIMDNAGLSLSPATKATAATVYQDIFEHPTDHLSEVIFLRGYEKQGVSYGYNIDHWGNPCQTRGSWPHPGRFNPTIDFVDNYECYSAEGEDGYLFTYAGESKGDYNGYDKTHPYKHFTTANGLYADKDQRLWGTCILPETIWKDTKIVIQAGYVKPDGEAVIEPGDRKTTYEVGGKTYYVYGAPAQSQQYSGFDDDGGNYTISGFLFKKFLNEDFQCMGGWNYSTTDYIDMRLSEVALNYAEAYAESGLGDAAKAKEAMNASRKRVGFTKDLEPTIKNVLRERRAELSFEQTRAWDLIRRREFHKVFDSTRKCAMKPVYDIKNQDWIFVRAVCSPTSKKRDPLTFNKKAYYEGIQGTGSNHLVQNPQY